MNKTSFPRVSPVEGNDVACEWIYGHRNVGFDVSSSIQVVSLLFGGAGGSRLRGLSESHVWIY